MRVGIIGDRPEKVSEWSSRENKLLRKRIRELILSWPGEKICCSGMELGPELFISAICFWENIPLISYLPYWDWNQSWDQENLSISQKLLRKSKEITYIHNGPYNGPRCLFNKNQAILAWLQEESTSTLLAVWNGQKKSPTWDSIYRAQLKKIKVISISP